MAYLNRDVAMKTVVSEVYCLWHVGNVIVLVIGTISVDRDWYFQITLVY